MAIETRHPNVRPFTDCRRPKPHTPHSEGTPGPVYAAQQHLLLLVVRTLPELRRIRVVVELEVDRKLSTLRRRRQRGQDSTRVRTLQADAASAPGGGEESRSQRRNRLPRAGG